MVAFTHQTHGPGYHSTEPYVLANKKTIDAFRYGRLLPGSSIVVKQGEKTVVNPAKRRARIIYGKDGELVMRPWWFARNIVVVVVVVVVVAFVARIFCK
jgi:hypothetical protein